MIVPILNKILKVKIICSSFLRIYRDGSVSRTIYFNFLVLCFFPWDFWLFWVVDQDLFCLFVLGGSSCVCTNCVALQAFQEWGHNHLWTCKFAFKNTKLPSIHCSTFPNIKWEKRHVQDAHSGEIKITIVLCFLIFNFREVVCRGFITIRRSAV